MALNIAVVEDDNVAAEEIQTCIRRFGEEYKENVTFARYKNADEFLAAYDGKFNLILMDIEMPGTDGMSAVRKLREFDRNVLVIFVTNLASCAINGYEVEAFDFVVKPISYYNFCLKLSRAAERIRSLIGVDIWVSNRDGKQKVCSEDVVYIEVMRHTITFHTKRGDITTGNGTLVSIRERLEGLPFALCNQCYLVNLRYVTGILNNNVIVGNYELHMSAAKKKNFMKALNDYLACGRLVEGQ